jgi:hypothetical protein
MARDIYVEEISQMVEICALLTERGHGFEVTRSCLTAPWRIRLTGAF